MLSKYSVDGTWAIAKIRRLALVTKCGKPWYILTTPFCSCVNWDQRGKNGLNSLVTKPRPAILSICVFFPVYLRWGLGGEEIKILPCAAYQGWQWRTSCHWQQELNNLYLQVQTETTKGRKREYHGWQVIPCAEILLFSNDDTAPSCPAPRPCRSQGHKWDMAPALFEFAFCRAPLC